MGKGFWLHPKFFVLKSLIFGVALSLALGCAGVKTEEKPTPTAEEKKEQPKKEETTSPQHPPEPPRKQADAPVSPRVSEPSKPTASTQPPPSPPPLVHRSTKILWESVNLRQGPGTNFKVIGHAQKGTSLIVLEEKDGWFRVRQQDGKEAWVTKAATSEAPKPSPEATPKPKPM
jgi:uncharacterized protein YgiM (DUF1202 family)